MPEGNQLSPVKHLQWCELEVSLGGARQPGECSSYHAILQFSRPNDKFAMRLPTPPPVVIDHQRLRECKREPIAYGKALWTMLFASTQMRRAFEIVSTNAQVLRCAVRLRLFIESSAADLHSLWWETLVDPDTDTPVLMREDVAFSRYLESPFGRLEESRPARRLRVLYALANPTDLDQWEVDGRSLGRPGMGGHFLPREVADRLEVVTMGDHTPVTLDRLVARLYERFDILYLVCHGALTGDGPRLFLENEQRLTEVVEGETLVARLHGMVAQPSMVVLASCQSAGNGTATMIGDDGALAALGPRLMEAGVQAVVAMQGNVAQSSAQRFMPVLFEHLAEHGQIERAMAVARGAIRQQRDWWVPVLFMRLKSGALWDAPPLVPGAPPSGFDWRPLVKDLDKDMSVMVLGSGLGEDVLGSRREIANEWVREHKFQMSLSMRDGIPQVTQYLAYTRDRNYPLEQLRRYLLYKLPTQHSDLLAGYRGNAGARDELDALVREIGKRMRACVKDRLQKNERARAEAWASGSSSVALPYPDQGELAYTLIARLPVTTYITTNRDNLLLDSLREEGRKPEVVVCRWRPMLPDDIGGDDHDWPSSVFDRNPDYEPSYEKPLIYHVFGNMSHPHTVVLTEDDYFDFLVGLSRNQGHPRTSMPPHVKKVLATHGLMFLGFQFDDWEFRTMFRGVLPREGVEAGSNRSNVAVQVEPDEKHISSAVETKDYMEKYFSQHRKIQVYWGKSDVFLAELSKQWKLNRQ